VQAEEPENGYVINPFEQRELGTDRSGGRYTTRISDEPQSRFRLSSFPTLPKPRLPKIPLLTSRSRTPQRGPKPPSTWDKVNSGAKTLFIKTKRTLMPWTDDRSSRLARTSRSYRPSSRSVHAPKPRTGPKTLFSSWFKPQKEEKEIRTVNDFLSLPPVPYE